MRTHRLLSAIAGIALALFPAPPRPAAAAAAPPRPLFLWRVTGAKGTVFLLGSIHAATADFYPLPRPIEKDFRKSSVLVEEIDLNRQDPAALRRLMLARGLYPPGDSLDHHISAETKRALQRYLQRSGQSPALFARMKPWLAAILISGSTIAAGGISGKYGIDAHFAQEAAALHKPIEALEGARFQLDLLSHLPERLQEAMLLSSLRAVQSATREVETLLAAWRAGDARRIARMIAHEERRYPLLKPLYDELLPDRNRAMAKRIAAYLDTPKTYFVVVGVGHLIGDRGIVALLRADHDKVERIDAR